MVSLTSPGKAMMPPATTSPKRPSLATKRDSSYLDTDDEAGLSTSTKKLRVTFDPKVDVRIMDDGTDKSYDLVKEEVQQGIERHLTSGDSKDDARYIKILQLLGQDVLSNDAPSPKLLRKYVLAVDSRVSYLGRCRKLAMAVLDLSWLGRDETFVESYIRFMCDLASAHGKYVPYIMDSLVPHFAKLPASTGELPNETPVPRTQMFDRVHFAIRAITRQVPSATSALMQALRESFPNDLTKTKSFIQYQKHALRIGHQIPELKGEVLTLIVQKLVGVDAQIQHDIEDLEEDQEEKLLNRPSSKDGNGENSDDSDDESISESEETMTEEEQRLRDLRMKVANMDGTINLLFNYYTRVIEKGSELQAETAYFQLLSHFESFILPNRCRHTQFLQFHFSQSSPERIEQFAHKCLKFAMADSSSSTHRLTACAYLASFVARGAKIPTKSVQNIMSILGHYLEEMRLRYEPSCRGPDKRSYALYYAIAQAMLYIFCFRWRDLVIGTATPESDPDDFDPEDTIGEGGELAWLAGMRETLSANLYCKLNPLKVASPTIVAEFSKIAYHLRFMYVFTVVQANKRLRLGQTFSYFGNGGPIDIGRRETTLDRKTGDARHQLEAYFPFDPYHLPKSKRWVAGEYNEWKLPRGLRKYGEEDSDEGEEEEEDGSESDGEYGSENESIAEENALEETTQCAQAKAVSPI